MSTTIIHGYEKMEAWFVNKYWVKAWGILG